MISALLLKPVLSTGTASAMEAVLGAVLERINIIGEHILAHRHPY